MSRKFKSDLRLGRALATWAALAIGALGTLAGTGAQAAPSSPPSRSPAPPPNLPEFRQLAPLPSVQTAAAAAGISLQDLAKPLPRIAPFPGDTVTALVSLTDGAKLQQWVIELTYAAANEKEMAKRDPATTFYTSTGNELKFDGAPAALDIRTFGPLTAKDSGSKITAPAIKRARVSVDVQFLALGLDRPYVIGERVRLLREANTQLPQVDLSIGPNPFPAELTTERHKRAVAVGITADDERAVIGSIMALVQFFQIASRTPGLQDVLFSVIEVPWWSILKSGGKMPGIGFNVLPGNHSLPAAMWRLPDGAAVWSVPYGLSLNDKPALVLQLAVTDPNPPLLPCAGIVGLAAGRPDGKGPVLTLQIVSARGAK